MPDIGAAGPPIPRQFATTPILTSGVGVQNTSGLNQILYATVTLNATIIAPSVFNAQLSSDGATWVSMAMESVPTGGVSLAGSVRTLTLQFPAGWWIKCTWSNAALSMLSSIV